MCHQYGLLKKSIGNHVQLTELKNLLRQALLLRQKLTDSRMRKSYVRNA